MVQKKMLMKGNAKSFILVILYFLMLQNFMTSCGGVDSLSIDTESATSLDVSKDIVQNSITQTQNLYQVTERDANNLLNSLGKTANSRLTVYKMGNDTLLYIAKHGKGWSIIAGDRRVSPIVAESDYGDISLSDNNSALAIWIDTYLDELKAIKQTNQPSTNNLISTQALATNEYTKFWDKISPIKKASNKLTRSASECKWVVVSYTYCDSETSSIMIPHLLKTTWGQSYPWNYKLPKDTKDNNKTCPTGCVSVSLAQIIYYMHYFLGKPTGLYHNINISKNCISGASTDIGFSRSNYVDNSSRWDEMALGYSTGNTDYVGDLMLDIGNRVNMKYSGSGSGANLSTSALSFYNLTYTAANYNYDLVKNDLQKKKPINVTAYSKETGTTVGHSWVIDGIATKTRHYVTKKQFEYTENWMYESEYYESFDDLKYHYNINSEFDVIYEDSGTYTTEYLLMNWGYEMIDNTFYGRYPSDAWSIGNESYKYDKKIYYDFR